MLECVPNVSEGRDADVVQAVARAAGPSLIDVHRDADHHRSVFTLAGPETRDAVASVRALALEVASRLNLSRHAGAHPRLGALDVVPFVALAGSEATDAVQAAREFAEWWAVEAGVPVFLYDAADPAMRILPQLRREAFVSRGPDFGPLTPHPRLGATAVGARRPLIAVNCELEGDDLALAQQLARQVRERDGGLPGVRALGMRLVRRGHVQVSMNLVDLARTGLEDACRAVEQRARAAGVGLARVELVGLVPRAELERCSAAFLAMAGITPEDTIEARLAARGEDLRR